MTPKTLNAIKESIAKWENKRDNEFPGEVSMGARSCPLCILFHPQYGGMENGWVNACLGCPVREKTNQPLCDGSPYQNALDIHENWDIGPSSLADWQAACQAEIDFLRSLLPPENQDGISPAPTTV